MQIDRGPVEKITPTRLVEAALVDIGDAERCRALHITPSTGTLLRRLREVTVALSETLEGVYETYRQLGEDTDGARNARELFGPMTDLGNPAAWVAQLVSEHRAEYEAEADIARGVALTEARNRLFDTAMPTEVCKMVEGYLDELIAEDFPSVDHRVG